eukprot:7379808-Prymnesium_polylepis.3
MIARVLMTAALVHAGPWFEWELESAEVVQEVLFSAAILFSWLRFDQVVQVSPTIGPLAITIKKLFWDVMASGLSCSRSCYWRMPVPCTCCTGTRTPGSACSSTTCTVTSAKTWTQFCPFDIRPSASSSRW